MKQLQNKSPNNGKSFITWVVIATLFALIYQAFGDINMSASKITFSEFITNVDQGDVREVSLRGNEITGKFSDGRVFNTLAPRFYPELITELRSKNVQMEVVPVETSLGSFFGVILSWFPVLLLIGVWIYFMKNMQGGGGKAMGFGRSKARLVSSGKKVTFTDVAGVDEAKEDLHEIVDFLKDPKKFQKLGGKIPTGCLLVGPPGTGKTLLARAVAGEAAVPFFTISGSDFVEMFVGVGASRVRDMFAQAKKQAPCIIFIDEIDAVGRHRGAGLGGGNDEREQTLNQLLVEMDGFSDNQGVIVVAATNRPDVLDPALLRPGRFDRQITVPTPDIKGRDEILTVHSKNMPMGPDVDLHVIARGTPGFAGADLANILNEGALLAARKNHNIITMADLEEARDKVMMGAERKSMIMKDDEKELTAYHEGGHALVTIYMPASDPIHKATIIPRGRALGMVMRLPESDRFSATRERLKADIAVAMGGRVAEELIFGHEKVTSGASSDIKMATSLARNMVTQWGLSDVIGPVLVGDQQDEVFLGHSLGNQKHLSDDLAQKIDDEIKAIVEEGYNTAKKILTKNEKELHLLAKTLIEYETLSGQEIKDLLAGKFDKDKKKSPPKKKTASKSKKGKDKADNSEVSVQES